jgi:hypothetical protein
MLGDRLDVSNSTKVENAIEAMACAWFDKLTMREVAGRRKPFLQSSTTTGLPS